MTLVHAETGEVLTDADVIDEMDEHEARSHTERMRGSLTITSELVLEAWNRRAWKSLGYRTWEEYLDGEFDEFALNAASRHVLMVGLRKAGMSVRSISRTTGASRNTVDRHVAQIEPPATVTGNDGKPYPATKPEARSGEAEDREDSEGGDVDDTSPDPVTDPGEADVRETPDGSVAVPPSPGSATSDVLDAIDPEGKAEADYLAYQTKVTGAIGSVRERLLTFPAAELAEVADQENWDRLNALLADLTRWFHELKESRPKPMRVINGGKS